MSLLSVIFLCSLIASIPLSLSLSLPCFYKKSQHSHEGQVSGASLHLHEDNELYHDEDGSTTQEINVAFVRGTRKQITLLIAVSFVGLAVNTAAAIVVEAGRDHALLRSGHSSRWWLFERSIRVVAAVQYIYLPRDAIVTNHVRSFLLFKA